MMRRSHRGRRMRPARERGTGLGSERAPRRSGRFGRAVARRDPARSAKLGGDLAVRIGQPAVLGELWSASVSEPLARGLLRARSRSEADPIHRHARSDRSSRSCSSRSASSRPSGRCSRSAGRRCSWPRSASSRRSRSAGESQRGYCRSTAPIVARLHRRHTHRHERRHHRARAQGPRASPVERGARHPRRGRHRRRARTRDSRRGDGRHRRRGPRRDSRSRRDRAGSSARREPSSSSRWSSASWYRRGSSRWRRGCARAACCSRPGLAFCFLLSWLADRIGLAPIVGAFAAGLILEEVHYRDFVDRGEHGLEELIHPISSFLVPIFFVLMGMRTDLRSFAQPGVLALAAALTSPRSSASRPARSACSARAVDRLSVGIGMIPRGEVGLIFANIGLALSVGGRAHRRRGHVLGGRRHGHRDDHGHSTRAQVELRAAAMTPAERALAAVGVVLVSAVAGMLLRRTLLPRLARWTEATAWAGDDLLVASLRRFLPFWCVLAGLGAALQVASLPPAIASAAEKSVLAAAVPGGVAEFEPFIRFNRFGDSSIDFTVIMRGREFTDNFLVKHEFIKKLARRFADEGIVIPFPIRAVNLAQEAARRGRGEVGPWCLSSTPGSSPHFSCTRSRAASALAKCPRRISTEYFLAGRTLPGWKAGISMAATQFAADTPLLVTGLIATAGSVRALATLDLRARVSVHGFRPWRRVATRGRPHGRRARRAALRDPARP